jgi:penicillin-binding protein 1A
VPVDLVEATVRSYNTVYAQLILDVGVDEALDVAASMGITTPLDHEPASVLGANDVQPLEMATAYATLANRGVRVDPVFVTSVVRNDGTILYEAEHHQQRVLDADVADQVTAVLEQVIQRGTGTAARLGRPAAGKTGTGQEYRNAWFCGYVPQLATAVWLGYAGQTQFEMVPPRTPIRVTGGSYPAQVWQDFMAAATDGLPVEDFVTPPLPPPASTTTLLPGQVPGPEVIGEGEIVPYLVGQDVDDADDRLRALGFRVTTVDHPDPSVRPGTVIAQSPPGGTRVTIGTAVTLLVAESSGSGGPVRPPTSTPTTNRPPPGASTTSTTRDTGPPVTLAPIG